MEPDEYREAQARLERDYLAGKMPADEYTRLRRALHEGTVDVGSATELASWGRRAAALLLDALFLLVALGATSAWGLGGLEFLLLPALYHWLMLGTWGQTLGKMALGVKVVRADDEGSIGYLRALGRVASAWLLGILFLPLLLAYLWPLWDSRNQTLYDKMAGTVVVRTR